MDPGYLVIEGNIGAGKTSLASMLAEDTGARFVPEAFAGNPFLSKFYKEPDRYAFQVELAFLAERYRQIKKELGQHDLFNAKIVSDYYLPKSIIFSKQTLKDDELQLFEKLFQIINLQAPKPDLYVYLHLPVDRLLENIRKRGRTNEQGIGAAYLQRIQDGYFAYFKTQIEMKILVIDTSNIDFVNRKKDYLQLKRLILNKEYKPGTNMLIL
ncbi:MAG: deoxynucleoside kinase [Bacteroidetes bacterium]|nr:MAG: deoxynucleoside kinase [Bacteroidota bacterium]